VLRHYPALLAPYSVGGAFLAVDLVRSADAQWVPLQARRRRRMKADSRLPWKIVPWTCSPSCSRSTSGFRRFARIDNTTRLEASQVSECSGPGTSS